MKSKIVRYSVCVTVCQSVVLLDPSICNIHRSTFIQVHPNYTGMFQHFIKISISLKYSTIESEKKLFFLLKALDTIFFSSIKKCFFFF